MEKSTKKKVALLLFITLLGYLIVKNYWSILFYFYPVDALIMNDSTSREIHKLSIAVGPGEVTTFCVQEAYLSFVNNLDENSGIGIDMDMEIETFEPWNIYYQKTIKELKGSGEKLTRQKVSKIKDRRITLSIDQGRGRGTDAIWKESLKRPTMERYGSYTRVTPQKSNHLVSEDYLLVPVGATDYSEIIACNIGAKCVLYAPFNQNLNYQLRFVEEYQNEILSLQQRIQSFIHSMICTK